MSLARNSDTLPPGFPITEHHCQITFSSDTCSSIHKAFNISDREALGLVSRLVTPQPAPSPPEPERGEGAPPAPPQRADSRLRGPRPVPSPAGHTPAPPPLRQFPPDPPGGGRRRERAGEAESCGGGGGGGGAGGKGRAAGPRGAARGARSPRALPDRPCPGAVPVGARSPGGDAGAGVLGGPGTREAGQEAGAGPG
ncbi:translation initiation factor IF-2-like [Lynx rufus]|uniref:translation initiation factor IF-2-like n=1 Tax=Lynx rufus TaxID=61384 RepID=UPI001F125B62|nr:translation initiation factor IF-2-like [Lynx rufus]